MADGARMRGRPKQWANEAERKRAYRQRLAADLAEPVRLRRELRAEKARSVRLTERLGRLERELDDCRRSLDDAAEETERLAATNEFLRRRVRTLSQAQPDESP